VAITNRIFVRCLSLVVVVALLVPQTANAQRKRPSPKTKTKTKSASDDDSKDSYPFKCRKPHGKVWVRFREEVELKDLITWAMGFTCRNFIFGSSVLKRAPKVRIISPMQMTPWQAWRVFLVALQTMNLTVVPKGNVLKVVETRQSKDESLPLYRRGHPAATDRMVRVIFRPEHIPPDQLEAALNILKSKTGSVKAIPAAGVVVITDQGSNIAKMRTMIRELDQPMIGERIYMIKVIYADVEELATKLNEILGTKDSSASTRTTTRRSRRSRRRGRRTTSSSSALAKKIEAAKPSKIMADERTNSLIVLASKAAYMRVYALVKRLDIPTEVEGAGRIHVYYLENADAEELANTLTTVISGITQARGSSSSRNRRNARTRRRTPTRRSNSGLSGAAAFEGNVRVTQDKPTNSLVVVASVKDYIAVRKIIRKLDAPRRQVFIEAVIAEVKVDNSRDLGVSFHGGKDLSDGSLLIAGLQHQDLKSLNVASLATQTGLLGGAIGPLLPNAEQLLGTSIPSFGLLFQALATNSNINVLSSPHILTTDNEEAEISVGENIPYQSSLTSLPGIGTGTGGNTTGGFGFPVQSIQRQDVALTLKITPHINASDMVRLEIDQEISDIASPNFAGLGPSWAKRTIKTTVVVRDEQSVVIGGLMAERETYSESKIPLLGDVPILGYLFKYTQKSKSKTNLLVLLTPYVVKDQMDIEQIVQRKVRERNEFLRSFSNLRRMKYNPHVDYRRKRGLVEEINHAVKGVEREVELIKATQLKKIEFKDGPVDYKHLDDEDRDNGAKNKKPVNSGAKKSPGASKTQTNKKNAKSKAGKK